MGMKMIDVCKRGTSALWKWYLKELDRRPLITQAATTGFICGLGDAIAQAFIERRQGNYDVHRTARMTFIGLLFTGPVLRGWFQTLDKGFGSTRTIQDAAKKVFFDQFVFAPVLIATLLSTFSLSQGMSRDQTREKLKMEYFNLLIGFYKLWPAAQLINFYFVPLNLRVSFANLVSLIWNTYVGYVANRSVHHFKHTDQSPRQ